MFPTLDHFVPAACVFNELDELEEESKHRELVKPLQDIAESAKKQAESAEKVAKSAEVQADIALKTSKKSDVKGWIAVIVSVLTFILEVLSRLKII